MIDFDEYPPLVLRQLTKLTRDLARDLDLAARRAEYRVLERQNSRDHRRRLRAACIAATKAIDSGADMDVAVKDAADRFCVRVDAIRLFRQPLLRKFQSVQRLERDRAIMKAYRAGLTDKQIAEKHGLHAKTVARIRRDSLKAMVSLL